MLDHVAHCPANNHAKDAVLQPSLQCLLAGGLARPSARALAARRTVPCRGSEAERNAPPLAKVQCVPKALAGNSA
eukprot:4713588-Alexandrium_andersonii.AAC.1